MPIEETMEPCTSAICNSEPGESSVIYILFRNNLPNNNFLDYGFDAQQSFLGIKLFLLLMPLMKITPTLTHQMFLLQIIIKENVANTGYSGNYLLISQLHKDKFYLV
jgi:hypothetical protein